MKTLMNKLKYGIVLLLLLLVFTGCGTDEDTAEVKPSLKEVIASLQGNNESPDALVLDAANAMREQFGASIGSVDICTKAEDVGKYDRDVIFKIPTEAMADKGNMIRGYMNAIRTKDIPVKEETEGEFTTFTFSVKNVDAESLQAMMQTVFGMKNAAVAAKDVDKQYTVFTFSELLEESVDLSAFAWGESEIPCRFFVSVPETLDVYNADTAKKESLLKGSHSSAYDGYMLAMEESFHGEGGGALHSCLLFQRGYQASELAVDTSYKGEDSWKNTICIRFPGEMREDDTTRILERLDSRLKTTYDGLSVEVEKEKERWALLIEQKGTATEISSAAAAMFGTVHPLSHTREDSIWFVHKDETYNEELDLEQFLGTVRDDFVSTYTLHTGSGTQMNMPGTENMTGATTVFDDGNLIVSGFGKHLQVSYEGTKKDWVSILFWIVFLLGLFIVLGIVFYILIRTGVLFKNTSLREKMKASAANRKQAKKDKKAAMKGHTKKKEEQEVPVYVVYCKNCGMELEDGEMLCRYCGQRVDNHEE